MSELHASIMMACLEDNLTMLSSATTPIALCKYCKKIGQHNRFSVFSAFKCPHYPHCGNVEPLARPAVATIFQSIWGLTAADNDCLTSTQAIKEQLAGLQQCLDPQEAMQLLMALVAKDYKGRL
jgi:hypothetical protein